MYLSFLLHSSRYKLVSSCFERVIIVSQPISSHPIYFETKRKICAI